MQLWRLNWCPESSEHSHLHCERVMAVSPGRRALDYRPKPVQHSVSKSLRLVSARAFPSGAWHRGQFTLQPQAFPHSCMHARSEYSYP